MTHPLSSCLIISLDTRMCPSSSSSSSYPFTPSLFYEHPSSPPLLILVRRSLENWKGWNRMHAAINHCLLSPPPPVYCTVVIVCLIPIFCHFRLLTRRPKSWKTHLPPKKVKKKKKNTLVNAGCMDVWNRMMMAVMRCQMAAIADLMEMGQVIDERVMDGLDSERSDAFSPMYQVLI